MVTVLSRAEFHSAFVRFSVPYNSQSVAYACFCLSVLYLAQRSLYLLWISFHVSSLAEPISSLSLSKSSFDNICPPRLTHSFCRLPFRSLHITRNVAFEYERKYSMRFLVA